LIASIGLSSRLVVSTFQETEITIVVDLGARFFRQSDFLIGGHPNDAGIKRFCETLINREKEFGRDFMVNRNVQPSRANLSFELMFPLKTFRKNKQIEGIVIRDLLKHREKFGVN
jgi:hypothetical protein